MQVEWEVQIRLKNTYEVSVMRAVLESIVKAIIKTNRYFILIEHV